MTTKSIVGQEACGEDEQMKRENHKSKASKQFLTGGGRNLEIEDNKQDG
jgi:hypothetical protein